MRGYVHAWGCGRMAAWALAAVCAALACASAAQAEVCSNQAARSGPSATLPDCRAYEMVSPANGADGEVYIPIVGAVVETEYFEPTAIFSRLPFLVAPNGDSVVYAGDPSGSGNGSIGYGLGNQYWATREPGGGWKAQDIQPARYKTPEYQAFSPELTVGVLDSEEAQPLRETDSPTSPYTAGPSGGYSTPYLRDLSSDHYQPLISAPPPSRSPRDGGVQEANTFGTANPGELPLPTVFAGGNGGANGVAPFEDLLFEANDVLSPGAPEPGAGANDLYEWHDGALQLENVLPQNDPEPANADAVFGAERSRPNEYPNFSNVISRDGTKVFWTDLENETIYVRIDGSTTAQVSEGPATYWTATPDGRYAYYIEQEQLLRYDVETGEREAIAGAGAGAKGVVAVNEEGEDGAYVYFVASAVLAPGASAGAPNLYLRHEDATKWIATLAAGNTQEEHGDNNNQSGGNELISGDWVLGLAMRTAQATPDGRGLAFMSKESLTGYDSGGLSEVFLFESGNSHLNCVSCNPDGTPPTIGELNEDASELPVSHDPTSLLRSITDDGGRVFFDTLEPLVPSDTNGRQDVYEWERDGEGSCETEQGCIYLLSGGSSSDVSALVGVSASGNDAFVATRAQLTPLDHNEFFDLYDARVEGTAPSTGSTCGQAGCEREGSSPPSFAVPPTATLSGVEVATPPLAPAAAKPKPLTRAQKLAKALKACHTKRNRSKRVSCERAARRQYAPQVKKSKAARSVR
jgi:hypothetical protein